MSAVEGLAEALPAGACGRCGGDNSANARFCQHCGTAIGGDDPVGWFERAHADSFPGDEGVEETGARFVVTAVVCELSAPPVRDVDDGPWALETVEAQRVDAETLEAAREILRRSGGTIRDDPDAIGTLTAVFGPGPEDGDGPAAAVRALDELRRSLATGGVRVRAGAGAAEIVGEGPDAEDLWRGRVVDLAMGLQRRADDGEVLVSEGLASRIADATVLEPVATRAPGDGDGAGGPHRLLALAPDAGPAQLGSPAFVGRDDERDRIRSAFERSVAERRGVLVRIVGDPGVGTTRLAEECVAELAAGGAATAVAARPGPASEPGGPSALAGLLEAVMGLSASTDADGVRVAVANLLGGRPDAERVAERILPALGLPGRADPSGTAWALLRVLEAAAAERPLLVLVESADRAGSWLLERLRSATTHASSPILVLATGARAGWPPSWEREPVEQVRLGPMSRPAMERLLGDLFMNPDLPPAVRDRLMDASGGNALHAEQLVAALADRGDIRCERGRWVPGRDLEPPELDLRELDLRELLSARLRSLGLKERAYLGLLAVAGSAIPSGLVEELAPNDEGPSIREHLSALVADRYLRSEGPAGRETYAFRHELVRALAGASVPPEIRAEVHERCARWLEERHADRLGRHASAIAAHLEAETRSGRAAGSSGGDPRRRAVGLLTSVAGLLSALGDEAGRVEALDRASELVETDDPTRSEVLLRTAAAFADAGRSADAERFAARATRAARHVGDHAVEARARLLRAVLADGGRRRSATESVWTAAEQAEIACAEAGDDAGLAAAWSARATVHRRWGHWAAAADDLERAAEHAARAGLARDESASLRALILSLEELAVPVDESIERCREVLARFGGHGPVAEDASAVLAILLARRGSFEEADEQVAAARGAAEDVDPAPRLARVLHRAARVQVMAGRSEMAEELLLTAFDAAVHAGDEGSRAAIGATLAHLMIDGGRAEEALRLLEDVSGIVNDDDVATQVAWRSAEARAFASIGRTIEARDRARRAIRLAEQTDLMDPRAVALLGLAQVLLAEDRPNEAAPVARRALRALERRGATAQAERARLMLGSIGRPTGDLLPAAPSAPDGAWEDTAPSADAPEGRWEGSSNGDGVSDGEGVTDGEGPSSPFAEFATLGGDLPRPPSHGVEDGDDGSDATSERHPRKTTGASWWAFGRR